MSFQANELKYESTMNQSLIMNSTNSSDTFNTTSREALDLWISCQITNSVCTLVDIYILSCLLLFHRRESNAMFRRSRREKKKLDYERSHVESSTRQLSRKCSSKLEARETRTGSSRNRKFKLWMLRVAIAASFIALIKFTTDQLKFFYAWDMRSDSICEIVNDVTEIGLYGMILNCIYGFLWMRQWLFYNNPAVRGLLYRKHLIRFSKCMVVVIVSVTSFTTIYHVLPQRYMADKSVIYKGCIAIYDMNKTEDMWPIALYIILTSLFQICLVSLFIYPFVRRKLDANAAIRERKRASSRRKHSTNRTKSFSAASKPPSSVTLTSEVVVSEDSSNKQMTSSVQLCGSESQCTSPANQAIPIPTNRDDEHVSMSDNGKQEFSRKGSVKIHSKKKLFSFCPKVRRTNPSTRSCPIRANSTQSVFNAVRRVVFWCIMCILSDITTVTVALMNGPGTSLILITVLNNVNIVVNMFCLVATYSRWREVLFPFLMRKLDNDETNRNRNFESLSSRQSSEGIRTEKRTVCKRVSTLKRSPSLNGAKRNTLVRKM